METNAKIQQLTFEKGLTNVPSDAICSDNALEECVGLVYDNGEHKVVQGPQPYITNNTGNHPIMLLYVHKPSVTLYIGAQESGNTKHFVFCKKDGDHFVEEQSLVNADGQQIICMGNEQITSIGKTLIISTSTGLRKFLWTGSNYKNYDNLPELKFEPYLYSETQRPDTRLYIEKEVKAKDVLHWSDSGAYPRWMIAEGRQEDFNNLAVGLYEKLKKEVCKKKGFCNPFLVMAALRLYDDSYTMFTNPIVMVPCVGANSHARINDSDNDSPFYGLIYYSLLHFTQRQNYSDFNDIVKGVTIFCTDDIETADTTTDQILPRDANWIQSRWIGRRNIPDSELSRPYSTLLYSDESNHNKKPIIKLRDQADIDRDIKEAAVFYELCTIGLKPVEDARLEDNINREYLETLTTKQFVKYYDYHSHANYIPEVLYSYNSRLNMAGVSRSFFEGFDYFMPYENAIGSVAQEYNYYFYVTIKTDNGEIMVKHEKRTSQKQGLYFYYPDSRATHVKIIKEVSGSYNLVLDEDLKEHPYLNGSSYFKGVPVAEYIEPTTAYTGALPVVTPTMELLPNYVIQSEVNNPFVFYSEGYYRIDTGKILAMSTTTHALSQGQFGQYPLLVFTDNGIWAMSVNSSGYFSAAHPMSREVCNNAKSVTQTDGAVFFSSDKGLMVVVSNDVKCVSKQMEGDFVRALKDAQIAYDYRDSLLWIINDAFEPCWVYSIHNGTLHICNLFEEGPHDDVYDFIDKEGTSRTIDTEHNEAWYEENTDVIMQKIAFGTLRGEFFKYITYATSRTQNNTVGITNFEGKEHFRGADGKPLTDVIYRDRDNTEYRYKNGVLQPIVDYIGIVNNYPDTLIQNGLDIYSLVNRISRDLDTTRYDATMKTRPMKLENAFALKSILQARHVCQLSDGATMSLRIYASNNLKHWVELHSLYGTPWKYYKFKYEFKNLSAMDRFSGTMLVTQERRTGRLW